MRVQYTLGHLRGKVTVNAQIHYEGPSPGDGRARVFLVPFTLEDGARRYLGGGVRDRHFGREHPVTRDETPARKGGGSQARPVQQGQAQGWTPLTPSALVAPSSPRSAKRDTAGAIAQVLPAQRPAFEAKFRNGMPPVPPEFELKTESVSTKGAGADPDDQRGIRARPGVPRRQVVGCRVGWVPDVTVPHAIVSCRRSSSLCHRSEIQHGPPPPHAPRRRRAPFLLRAAACRAL